MRNGLITGLPRSGTTLVCHLLNKLLNVVALHEPLDVFQFRGMTSEEVMSVLIEFFNTQRQQILSTGLATSKSKGGRIPTNSLTDTYDNGIRTNIIDSLHISIENITSNNFDLFVKHPSLFTAMLPMLEGYFDYYACIRNPLAVLFSWQNANMPCSFGRAPAAEMVAVDLMQELDKTPDVLGRQLILLNFFFQKYKESKTVEILRYEDVIASAGKSLQIVHRAAENLSEKMTNRNHLGHIKSQDILRVAHALLDNDNACWHFYTREEVQNLLNDTLEMV